MMKIKMYSALIGCSIVGVLFATGDHLPVGYLLMPGFLIGLLFNGSLHDRVMPYLIIGVLANCILYSGIAYLAIHLLQRRRV
jgi:hypothetical protein